MAITVLESPAPVSLSRNPIILELQTNNTLFTNGAKARHVWEFSSLPGDGDQFNLQWLDGAVSLDFEYALSPDDSGLQLPTVTVGTVISYITNTLIPALELNYYIDRDYTVGQSGNRIFLEAKENGARFDAQFTSGNIGQSFTQSQAGIDDVPNPLFRLKADCYVRYYNDSDWTLYERERVPIDNKAVFDFSRILRAYDQLITPTLPLSAVQDVSQQMAEYKIRIAESYEVPGGSVLVRKMNELQTKLCLPGGLQEDQRGSYDWLSSHAPKFLSWRLNRSVRLDEPAFLNFLNTTIYNDFWVVIRLFGENGLIQERIAASFTAELHELTLIPSDYNFAVTGATLNGQTVTSYTIRIQRNGTTQIIGEEAAFAVDDSGSHENVLLAYQNGFGVLDTLRLRGEADEKLSVQAQLAEWQARYDTDFSERGLRAFNQKIAPSFMLRSGYLSKSEIKACADLLSSTKRFIISNNRWYPIQVEEVQNYPLHRTKNANLYGFSLEARLIKDENRDNAGNSII